MTISIDNDNDIRKWFFLQNQSVKSKMYVTFLHYCSSMDVDIKLYNCTRYGTVLLHEITSVQNCLWIITFVRKAGELQLLWETLSFTFGACMLARTFPKDDFWINAMIERTTCYQRMEMSSLVFFCSSGFNKIRSKFQLTLMEPNFHLRNHC